jgi:membrane protease subunit HflK
MADQPHLHPETPPLETPIDAGSQALSEAMKSSFGVLKLVMVVLVAIFVFSGVFTVGPQEQAIVIRLGKPVGEGEKALLGPGFHWSWPYPIDEHIKVPITAIQKVTSTVGWWATTPAMEAAGTEPPAWPNSPINPLVDGYALTADNNIVQTRATLTYHIKEPTVYQFNFVNASNMVLNALDNALLYDAARFKVDDILTHDIAGYKEAVLKRVRALVDQEQLGIVVEECLVESKPPRQLKDAFKSVLDAEITRGKVLNTARSDENRITNRAGADAKSLVDAAESARSLLVKNISGEAERFNELLPRYRENPALFAQKNLTETLGRVMTNVENKIFLTPGAPGQPKEFRMLLNREPPKSKTEETKP